MKKVVALVVCVVMLFSVVLSLSGCGGNNSGSSTESSESNINEADVYKEANSYFEAQKYDDALVLYNKIPDYEDAADKIKECKSILTYKTAIEDMNNKNYKDARDQFSQILDYKDSESKYNECSEKYATELYYDKKYTEAKAIYDEIKSTSFESKSCNTAVLKEYILNNGSKLGDNELIGSSALFTNDTEKLIITKTFTNNKDDEIDDKMDNEYMLAILADKESSYLYFVYFSKGTTTDNGATVSLNSKVEISTGNVDAQGDLAYMIESENTHYLGKGLYVNSYDDYFPMYVEKGKKLKRVAISLTEMKDGKTTNVSDLNRKQSFAAWNDAATNDGYQDIIANANELLKTTGLNITMKGLGFDKLD